MVFEGYTGGGGKESIDGLMSTGDVGHFDEDGRLFIDGRDDEMIVSGGENVFPRGGRGPARRHPAVLEAAVSALTTTSSASGCAAFVVVRRRRPSPRRSSRSTSRRTSPRYKVPREVVFVDELPRNATGKVLKRELATDSFSAT